MMRILSTSIGIAMALLPELANAQSIPPPLCTLIPGCGNGSGNPLLDTAIPELARIFLNASAALAVIFVIIGGGRYLLSLGREEELTKGKNTIMWAIIGLVVALTSHRIVMTVISETYTGGSDPILGFFASVVRILTTLLNVVFLIVVIASGYRMVMARGKEDEVTKGRHGLMYAIAGAVIINVAPYVITAVLRL